MLDATTGLLYVGNGQYYDPATGRFLTRDVYPNSTNPYVPWNPIGAILAPLAVLSMFYGRKKKRSKWDSLVILVLLGVTVGIGVVACAPQPSVTPASGQQSTPIPSDNTSPPNPAPSQTPRPGEPGTVPTDAGIPPIPPVVITTPDCPTATFTLPTPTATLMPTVRDTLLNRYGIKLIDGNLTWTARDEGVVLIAVSDLANRMGSIEAFTSRFGTSSTSPIYLVMGTSSSDVVISDYCKTITGVGGCTTGKRIVNFSGLSDWYTETARNNVVHELGHIFNNWKDSAPANSMPERYYRRRGEILLPTTTFMWQLHFDTTSPTETFADFFVAWTYHAWLSEVDGKGNQTLAGEAKNWMYTNMSNNW